MQLQSGIARGRKPAWVSLGVGPVQAEAEDTEPGEGEPGTALWPQDDGTDKTTAVAKTGKNMVGVCISTRFIPNGCWRHGNFILLGKVCGVNFHTNHQALNIILKPLHMHMYMCTYDCIWQNPAYGMLALLAQCAFLVSQVKNMSKLSFCHIHAKESYNILSL